MDTVITKWDFGFDHQKHIIHTSFFFIFIEFRCVLSGFDPNFVTINQVWSQNYQFYPFLMRLSKVNQKKTMKTTTMRMENEGIFTGIPKISNFSPGIL